MRIDLLKSLLMLLIQYNHIPSAGMEHTQLRDSHFTLSWLSPMLYSKHLWINFNNKIVVMFALTLDSQQYYYFSHSEYVFFVCEEIVI